MLGFITEIFFMGACFGGGWFGHMYHVHRKRRLKELLDKARHRRL